MKKDEVKDYFQAIGANIYYEAKGTGPNLLFIHAGIADCRMWEKEYNALAKDYHVIKFDIPGYGLSNFTGGDFSFKELINELLEFLQLDKVHIIAASFGGNIAMDFALSYPDKCLSLVLQSPALSGWEDSEYLQEYCENEGNLLDEKNYEKVAELNYDMWILGNRNVDTVDSKIKDLVFDMQMKFLMKEEPESPYEEIEEMNNIERIGQIKVPVLLINGDKDVEDFLEISNRLNREISSSTKVIIENAGHLANLEVPELFLESILNFYQKNETV